MVDYKNDKECAHGLELDFKKQLGERLSPSEIRELEHHVSACGDCQFENSVLEILADDDTAGALPVLDDLSRRRAIDEIILQADVGLSGASIFDNEKFQQTNHRWRSFTIAAAALLVITLGTALLWWTKNQDPSSTGFSEQTTTSMSTHRNGQFVLMSGEVLVSDHSVAIGSSILPGDILEVREGRAVVTLPYAITLTATDRSRIVFRKHENSGIDLHLDYGHIQVSLDPKKKRPKFTVHTDRGEVVATGTVFSVTAADEAVEVRVLRGEVAIKDRNRRSRRLRSSGATALGSSRVWTLSKKEEENLWEEVRAVDMLDVDGTTIVDISSSPLGALVEIDSVIIGRTPVSAAVRNGYRELALNIENRQMARKLVDLTPGAHLAWDFDLTSPLAPEFDSDRKSERETGNTSTRKRNTERSAGLSAHALLSRAQSLRAERDWQGAERVYSKLITLFPRSNEARAAYVSLGEIQLDKLGRPISALRHFENYLAAAARGPLAQEALYGKARALRALHKREAERKTLEKFLINFPSALQVKEVRARLSILESSF